MLTFLSQFHKKMKRKIRKINIPSGRYSFRRLRNPNEGKNCRVSGTAVISKPIVIVSTTGSTVIDNQVNESNFQASHETQIEEANVLLTRTTQGITTHMFRDQNNEIINLDNGHKIMQLHVKKEIYMVH